MTTVRILKAFARETDEHHSVTRLIHNIFTNMPLTQISARRPSPPHVGRGGFVFCGKWVLSTGGGLATPGGESTPSRATPKAVAMLTSKIFTRRRSSGSRPGDLRRGKRQRARGIGSGVIFERWRIMTNLTLLPADDEIYVTLIFSKRAHTRQARRRRPLGPKTGFSIGRWTPGRGQEQEESASSRRTG